jgi:hypothetical protein
MCMLWALEWENFDSRRGMSKATLLYKILNDCNAPNLKELLTRRNNLPREAKEARNQFTLSKT